MFVKGQPVHSKKGILTSREGGAGMGGTPTRPRFHLCAQKRLGDEARLHKIASIINEEIRGR